MKKRTVSLITMTLLLFALSLPHESFAQNGKWKKLARKAAAFTVGVIATSQGEDAATAMEATTWALGGDESEMSENSRMANYTVQDLKEDVSYKIGETIVNRQEEKEQQAIERRREERRIEEQYDNEYNKNYEVSESFNEIAITNSDISDIETVFETNTVDLEDLNVEVSAQLHEYVDLGLPSGLKWATCNIGANTPEESGDYFTWEEITTIESIGQDINAQSDIVADNQNDNWHIPTYSEMQELLDKCTWEWTKQSGQNGYKVIGPNGNSIFLPAAGICTNTFCSFSGGGGFYWTATPKGLADAYSLNFHHKEHNLSSVYSRYNGLCIRPVSD